ncbi:MAG: pyruvate, phosphate dikinase [Spirochaetia bacterium]|nr:pyruvate, phosphate dikinase [Spirochaetia bacterium]
MMPDMYPFSQKGCTTDQALWERSGKRGKRAFELAAINMPIVPGYILDSRLTPAMDSAPIKDLSTQGLVDIEAGIGRKYGAAENPLLLKIVISSNLSLPIYPTVFNVGLSPQTIPGFAKMIGERAAWFEYCYLLRTAGTKLYDVPSSKFDEIEKKFPPTVEGTRDCAMEMIALLGKDKVPDDPIEQLVVLTKNAGKRYHDPELDPEDQPALIIQGLVFGNIGEGSCVGMYYTRDIVSGENKLSGSYLMNSYTLDRKGEEIAKLEPHYLEELKKIGQTVERQFKEIREIKFIVENKRLWVINQTAVDAKSTQAHVRTMLDLLTNGVVDDKWVINQIPPGQLATLLHPIVDPNSLQGMPVISGGLAGSPGAAVGRAYFSADRLMEAHREAIQKGEDTRMILCVVSSFAEDVKAIEVGMGVVAVEGGYSSHAPVVARSLGKVAIINPNLKIANGTLEAGGHVVKEGDYITLDVPFYKPPVIGLGRADLINPDITSNGLVEFIEVVKRHVKPDFVVRANGDLGRDARVAKSMGAYGIGLCRTEHMFFQGDRIHRFREMILAKNLEERVKALDDLRPLQRDDFYDLFKTMAPHPVTIRLLDAPLHEFLPRSEEVLADYLEYLKRRGVTPDKKDISERIELMHEFNPMLGHRGCRVAVTYPEIYEMQVRGIFEAAARLKKEGVEVVPEIMIPIVMNPSELTFIKNGKRIEGKYIKGIRDVYNEVSKDSGVELHYKVGTMVELPAAALLSDELARYAEFFSFGTNDLTQTTFGLSRDDVTSFFPAYTEFDILANNPFQILGSPVKELIRISASRGKLTRPDIHLGLCGEHGADPANIEFCKDSGLHYVSCSPYSVPIALLAVAQLNLKQEAAAAKK